MPPSVRALEWRLLFATLTGQPPACDDAACTAAAPDGAPATPRLAACRSASRAPRAELEAAAGAVELIEQGRYQVRPGGTPVALRNCRSRKLTLRFTHSQDVLALPMAAAMLPSPPPYEAPSGADAEAAALAAATAASQHYAAVRASLGAPSRARVLRGFLCAARWRHR